MTQYSALFTLTEGTAVHCMRHFCDTVDEMRLAVWCSHPNTDFIISITEVPYEYY